MNKRSFINLPGFCILFGSFFQILWRILTIDTKLYPCTCQFFIDFLKKCSNLIEETVSRFFC